MCLPDLQSLWWPALLHQSASLSFMMTSSNGDISVLPALCAGNSLVTGEFPSQRPVTRNFDVFFDLRMKKRLSKQSRRRWFETPSFSLWCHCKVMGKWIIASTLPWNYSFNCVRDVIIFSIWMVFCKVEFHSAFCGIIVFWSVVKYRDGAICFIIVCGIIMFLKQRWKFSCEFIVKSIFGIFLICNVNSVSQQGVIRPSLSP